MREKEIIVKISPTEKRFLDFCRDINYAEFTCIVMKGEPVKAIIPHESKRFDLPIDNISNSAILKIDNTT